MIEEGAVKGIAILAGMAGLLIGALLERVGRRKAVPPRRRRVPFDPPQQAKNQASIERTTVVVPTPNQLAPLGPALQRQESQHVSQATLKRAGVIHVGASSVITRRPTTGRAATLIRPINRPYWQLRHWERKGDRLTGFYRTPGGTYEGYILHPNAPRPEFFIKNPPAALKRHHHWICFHAVSKDSYSIHFSPAPPNPDAGILAVEKVLSEALTGKGRRNG